MIYDFDTPVNRRNTDSVKWAVKENELPMWIADMDFEVIPQIKEAIKKRADEAVYGKPGQGHEPRGYPLRSLGQRLFRRAQDRGREHPAPSHQDRGRSHRAGISDHRVGLRLQVGILSARC